MAGDGFVTRHVVVTREHIEKGKQDSLTRCPVALALGHPGVHVWGPNYCLSPSGDHMELDHFSGTLPGKVAAWIEDFDDGNPVEPIEFDIDWPVGA